MEKETEVEKLEWIVYVGESGEIYLKDTNGDIRKVKEMSLPLRKRIRLVRQ